MLKRVFNLIASFSELGKKEDWMVPKGNVRNYLVERNASTLEL